MHKFEKKIDLILWGLIWLAPFLGYIVTYWMQSGADPVFTYIETNYAFPFVRNIINQIWRTAFGSNTVMAGYISYLVGVEIIHAMFDALIFIPRFAHNFIEHFTDKINCKKEK